MYQKEKSNTKYVVIFLFTVLFYFMFFHSDRRNGIDEVDFNKTLLGKDIAHLYSSFGEPDYFEHRGDFYIVDFEDFVVIDGSEPDEDIRYSKVRLLFSDAPESPLFKKGVFFIK